MKTSRSSNQIVDVLKAFGLAFVLLSGGFLLRSLRLQESPQQGTDWALALTAIAAFTAGVAVLVLSSTRRRLQGLNRWRTQTERTLAELASLAKLAHESAAPSPSLPAALESLRDVWEAEAIGLWDSKEDGQELTLRVGVGNLSGARGSVVRARTRLEEIIAQDPHAKLRLELIHGSADKAFVQRPAHILPIPHTPLGQTSSWMSLHGLGKQAEDEWEGNRLLAETFFNVASMSERHRRLELRDAGLASLAAQAAGLTEALAGIASLDRWTAAEVWATYPDRPPERLAAWQAEEQARAFVDEAQEPHHAATDPFPGWSEPKSAEPMWHASLADLPRFARSQLAQRAGLRSALVLPVSAEGGRALSVVLYGPDDRPPDTATVATAHQTARFLGAYLDQDSLRHETEKETRRLSEVLAKAPVAVAQCDFTGTILWCNQAELDLVGYSTEEYIGRNVAEFLADAESRNEIRRLLRQGAHGRSLESRLIRKGGTLRKVVIGFYQPAETRSQPVTWIFSHDLTEYETRQASLEEAREQLELRLAERTQELIRVNQEHMHDIARLVEAEHTTAKAENRARSLIQHIVDILVAVDSQARITFISSSVERKLGLRDEELVGSSLYDLVHPDDLSIAMDGLTRMMREPGRSHQFNVRLRREDSSWAVTEAVGRNYVSDGSANSVVMNLRDIGHRLEREAALRESEERFSLLVRSVRNYAIILLDPDGRVASWNDGAARISGYASGEIVGQHFERFYPPEDARQGLPRQHLELALAEGRVGMVGRRVRKDGTMFWAEVSITPLFDDQQRLRGFAKVTRDVSERMAAEERLRRSEQLLSEAERIAQIGSWEWDIASDRVTWSVEFARILGLGNGTERHGLEAFLEWVPPDDQQAARQAISDAQQERRDFSFEHRIVRPDGEVRVLHTRGFAVSDDEGRPLRIVATGQDITERKQMEEALQMQTELHLTMLSAQSELGEGVLLSEGDRIIYANHAFSSLFGLEEKPPRSLRGFLDAVDPADSSSLRQELEERVSEIHPTVRGGASLKRRDGRLLHIGYTLASVAGSNRLRTFAVFRDETERRQALEALESSREQLRQFSTQVERAREEESARISREIHDELGQQLTGLKLDLAWLANHLPKVLPEESNPLLDKVKGMKQLADTTIEQVRRIAAELRPGVLDDLGLSAALEWQAGEFQTRYGIRCHLESDPQAETMPPEYATAMFRIFQEALTNIARHAQAKTVEVALRVEDSAFLLTVADDGRGIDDADLHRNGSLGLLGMRERARLLGGETVIRRGRKAGTVVEVRLPKPDPALTGSP
ncbi:MAG TPA: PAS domain S-box protein [Anaerolineales bacterium]|nr:PAS domain S-box protein [Anaerolineales bacterium]